MYAKYFRIDGRMIRIRVRPTSSRTNCKSSIDTKYAEDNDCQKNWNVTFSLRVKKRTKKCIKISFGIFSLINLIAIGSIIFLTYRAGRKLIDSQSHTCLPITKETEMYVLISDGLHSPPPSRFQINHIVSRNPLSYGHMVNVSGGARSRLELHEAGHAGSCAWDISPRVKVQVSEFKS